MNQEFEPKTDHVFEIEQPSVYAAKAEVADYKADAIEAENTEHTMTVLEAVKAYPMASFWAFVMSCTIVSGLFPLPARGHTQLTSSDYGILRCFPYR